MHFERASPGSRPDRPIAFRGPTIGRTEGATARLARVPEPPSPAPAAREPADDLTPETNVQQDLERVLFSEDQIVEAVDALATRVTETYRGRDLSVVAVLKGSCIFAADLIRRLPIPMKLGFTAAESYRSGTVSGNLDVVYFPRPEEVEGRDILLVDDILDSGHMLGLVRDLVLQQNPASVRVVVLLDKQVERSMEIEPNYVGFEVPDVFVVGYGLDFDGYYRNLPAIHALEGG